MGARSALRRLAWPAAAVTLLVGCAVQATSRDEPVSPATVMAVWGGCWAVRPFSTTYEPNTVDGAGTVPADFQPASAVECVDERQRSADGSIVSMGVERRASDVAALTAAFALPSIRVEGASCPAVGWERPWLFLLDAEGRWIYPRIPTDACDQPRARFSAAYRSTDFRTVRSRLIRVEEPIAAIRAGCSGTETDMAWFVTSERRKKAGTLTADPLGGRRARLCVYSVPSADDGPRRPAGRFVAGRPLDDHDRAAIVGAMVGSVAAAPCRGPARTFAALHRVDDRGASVYVELTGCRRVVVVYGENHYLLSRASPRLRQLLDR